MADDDTQESDSLHLLGLTLSAEINWINGQTFVTKFILHLTQSYKFGESNVDRTSYINNTLLLN